MVSGMNIFKELSTYSTKNNRRKHRAEEKMYKDGYWGRNNWQKHKKEWEMDRWVNEVTDRQINKTMKQTDRHKSNRQTERQTDKKDKYVNRHTQRQTTTHKSYQHQNISSPNLQYSWSVLPIDKITLSTHWSHCCFTWLWHVTCVVMHRRCVTGLVVNLESTCLCRWIIYLYCSDALCSHFKMVSALPHCHLPQAGRLADSHCWTDSNFSTTLISLRSLTWMCPFSLNLLTEIPQICHNST